MSSDTPWMCHLTRMVLPSAAASFWAAVGLQRYMIIAACLTHALRSLSAAVTTLLSDHISVASQNASQNSHLMGAGVPVSKKKLHVKVKKLRVSLAPVP